MLLKGLKVKSEKLVKNILQSLFRLLETDEHFKVQGQESSVYVKMAEKRAMDYITCLTDHSNQEVFRLAESIYELFSYYDNQFGEDELIIVDQPNSSQQETQ